MGVEITSIGPAVDLRVRFAPQRRRLLSFLRGLDESDWRLPTACDGWSVADVVAHMLGDVLGRISGARDQAGRVAPLSGETLEQFIDRINGEWVVGCRKLSPRVLIEMLEWAGHDHDFHWFDLDPWAPSLGVSWAGVDPAPVWFDAARDITEFWVHERQLRDAVGDSGMPSPSVDIVLDVFVRGLPHSLSMAGDLGGVDSFRLSTESASATWLFEIVDGAWQIAAPGSIRPTTEMAFGPELLWRRWTRQPIGTAFDSRHLSAAERAVLNHVAIVHSDPGD